MYTIRPYLLKAKKNDRGFCPLKIIVTIQRKKTAFKTPFSLREDQWSGTEIINYTNANTANALIRKQISEIEAKIHARALDGNLTTKQLRQGEQLKYFATFAKEVREDKKEIARVKNFAGEVLLSEMTVTWLRKYESAERKRKMSQNTVNTTFKYLRRILNQAKAEKFIKENPFDEYAVPKYQQSERVYLTLAEIDKLEAKLPELSDNSALYLTAVYFLFGCYTGLRFSDWSRFDLKKHVENGRVILRAKKNRGLVSIKIYPRLQKILDRMKNIDPPYTIQTFNRYLKDVAMVCGIKKNITCHVSRHTNATLLATMGVSSDVVAELLGVNKQTVGIYYKITGVKIDKETSALENF